MNSAHTPAHTGGPTAADIADALSPLQQQVLGVICATDQGRSARQAADDLLVAPSSARSAIDRLEKLTLVQAAYTGHEERGRVYSATKLGDAVNRESWDKDRDEGRDDDEV